MKKILATILAIVLVASMAISAFAATTPTKKVNSVEGEVGEKTQKAGTDIVVTVEDGTVIAEPNPEVPETTTEAPAAPVAVAVGDSITFVGIENDAIEVVEIDAPGVPKTTILVNTETGKPALSLVKDGKIKAAIKGPGKYNVTDNAKTFSDVAGDPNAEAISVVAALGLMKGTGDDKFSPAAPATGATVFTTLARLVGADLADTGADWAAAPTAWAVSKGLTDGSNAAEGLTGADVTGMLNTLFGTTFTTTNTGAITRGDLAGIIYDYLNVILG